MFWAATSVDIPAAEVSSSAKYSPWADSRGAAARHESRTTRMPAVNRIRFRASARSSTRRAPEMIDLPEFHCHTVSPRAAPRLAMLRAGTSCSRTSALLNRPARSTIVVPASSATRGDRPAQST